LFYFKTEQGAYGILSIKTLDIYLGPYEVTWKIQTNGSNDFCTPSNVILQSRHYSLIKHQKDKKMLCYDTQGKETDKSQMTAGIYFTIQSDGRITKTISIK
jgi:hypothetical protein